MRTQGDSRTGPPEEGRFLVHWSIRTFRRVLCAATLFLGQADRTTEGRGWERVHLPSTAHQPNACQLISFRLYAPTSVQAPSFPCSLLVQHAHPEQLKLRSLGRLPEHSSFQRLLNSSPA
jgi:hypothetical protein